MCKDRKEKKAGIDMPTEDLPMPRYAYQDQDGTSSTTLNQGSSDDKAASDLLKNLKLGG